MLSFSLNHIALSVKDVNKAIDFYISVFDFKEIENTASDSKTRWLSFDDGIQLHLIPRPNDVIKTSKAGHFALSTKDIEGVISRLDKLGIQYSDWRDTPKKDYIRKDGIRQIYFQDFDGYWIEINNDV
ncbi:glyoxalase [Winogradskyella sp. PC-19]|uniref:VOC family protein n=1 Tax=unclassified Winogradskyella TaxID=2615021 RepID=UPI000B3C43B2|nr:MULTISPECIES: VOC family protein [unclassified Winogradskyella]ARV10500.1 glyoxalase [Winogradskyella sp. PC-19]